MASAFLIVDFTYNIFFLAMKELIIMPNNNTKLLDVDNVVCVFVTLSLSNTHHQTEGRKEERGKGCWKTGVEIVKGKDDASRFNLETTLNSAKKCTI